MADWKTIPDTDVDPDAPVTSELMYALRDNPVAIAEGADGAPRVTQSSFMAPTLGSAYKLGGGTLENSSGTQYIQIMGSVFMSGMVSVSYTKSGGTGTVFLLRNSTVISSRSGNGTTNIEVNLASGDYLQMRVDSSGLVTGVALVTSGTDAVTTGFAGRYD